jgi:glycosyltransferase involved in cell wall biosynthesis
MSSGESKINKLKRLIFSPIALYLKIKQFDPAIVHLNPPMDSKGFFRDAAYLLVVKLLHKKIVLQLHGGLDSKEFFDPQAWLRLPRKLILQRADAVILLTKLEYRHAIEFCNFKRIKVIPNAINVSAYAHNIKTLDSNTEEIVLIYIGRLVVEKGLLEAVRAMALLKDKGHAKLKFKIAGTGPLAKELENLIDNLAIRECVELVGPVFGAQKILFWRSAHILVFPTYYEGLPYALLEALAAGVPAITTEVGGIPEVIENGAHGIFVRPKNIEDIAIAITKIIENPNIYKSMVIKCIALANEKYDIKKLAADIDSTYQELL